MLAFPPMLSRPLRHLSPLPSTPSPQLLPFIRCYTSTLSLPRPSLLLGRLFLFKHISKSLGVGVSFCCDTDSSTVEEDEFDVELGRLVALLPEEMRRRVSEHSELHHLIEVVMDLGRRPLARFPSGDFFLSDHPITCHDLQHATSQVGDFAIDNRAGISRTLHRISAIKNRKGAIIGLTCRVGRAISGSANLLRDLVKDGASLLLIGPPGVGKTTIIREIARMLADDYEKRVMIVDTSNEIGGDGDIPHAGIGNARRMQVPNSDMQHKVLIEAVENHMPQVIVIDEIGTKLEAIAASTIAQRGIQLVATAHGVTIENLIMNPSLEMLVGGIQRMMAVLSLESLPLGFRFCPTDEELVNHYIRLKIKGKDSDVEVIPEIGVCKWELAICLSVTLGDEEASRRGVQKTVLERKGPSTFTCGVEIISKSELRVHRSLEATVDAILSGFSPKFEVRKINSKGLGHETLTVQKEPLLDVSSLEQNEVMINAIPEMNEEKGSCNEFTYEFTASMEEGSCYDDLPLHLYVYGIPETSIIQGIKQLKVDHLIGFTNNISTADALLALQSKLKKNSRIQAAVRSHGIPIYVTKTTSMVQIMKAMQAFVNEHAVGLKGIKADEKMGSSDKIDALEEVRLAIEQFVIPKGEPVELLARSSHIMSLQIDLIQKYHLQWEKFGEEPDVRLRILPLQIRMDKSGHIHDRIETDNVDSDCGERVGEMNGSLYSVDRLPLLPD